MTSRAIVQQIAPKSYKVVLDYHEPVYILAEDSIDAAYQAQDVASELNCYLEDVIPND